MWGGASTLPVSIFEAPAAAASTAAVLACSREGCMTNAACILVRSIASATGKIKIFFALVHERIPSITHPEA